MTPTDETRALVDAINALVETGTEEIERLRARVSEADELRARAEASVASMSAEMTAARELIGVQWWLLEPPLCGSRSFMDGLRRAFEARERDAALGARVRKAVKRAHAHFGSTHDRIIAAAVINHLAEEGGSDAG